MIPFILWYLSITSLGLLAFPLAFRMLPALPDRGYTLSRALGWLLWGYFFWLMGSFGIAQNDRGGLYLGLILLVGLSAWVGQARFGETAAWMKRERKLILTVEILFLVAFAAWAFVRAANPEIRGTEKPMELAFINAILRSPSFPPNDPWLSGYAISYYYFGYVLVAMLTRLTGVVPGVAFNLAIALLFALTAIGAYGLVYNLLHLRGTEGSAPRPKASLGLPLLGPLFILLVSNLEGFLEVLHARGLFWSTNPDGGLQSRFWSWLGVLELNQPPAQPFTWMPNRPGGVLYWRASRVLADYQLDGTFREVIDEFPFFSYLLADLHPHVLAMPFALLVIALALHIFVDRREKGFRLLGYSIPLSPSSFMLTGVALGGLAFLNTWDFPIYLALFSGAFIFRKALQSGWTFALVGDFLRLAIALGVTGVLLYLPFYIGFSSQAGGFLPSLVFFTRGAHLWVMFAPLMIPIFAYLFYLQKRSGSPASLWVGIKIALGAVAALWVFSYLLGIGISLIPGVGDIFLANLGAWEQGIGTVLREATRLRLSSPGGWLTLLALFALVIGFLEKLTSPKAVILAHEEPADVERRVLVVPAEERTAGVRPGAVFTLLLILIGTLLVLAPEFFYLRDQFGGRMNTIFKFYFQAWLIWGIAAAFGTAVLLRELRQGWGLAFRLGIFATLAAALVYPVVMTDYKTDGFKPGSGFTLDGTAYRSIYEPDETAAIQWLAEAPLGVVAEAIGPQYSSYARVAVHSGQPTVLGWVGHEGQWRGGYAEVGSREGDIETLYRTNNWDEAQRILKQYQIRYVFVGVLERGKYRVSEAKFERFMLPVYQSGPVTVYESPDQAYQTFQTSSHKD